MRKCNHNRSDQCLARLWQVNNVRQQKPHCMFHIARPIEHSTLTHTDWKTTHVACNTPVSAPRHSCCQSKGATRTPRGRKTGGLWRAVPEKEEEGGVGAGRHRTLCRRRLRPGRWRGRWPAAPAPPPRPPSGPCGAPRAPLLHGDGADGGMGEGGLFVPDGRMHVSDG